MHRFYSHFQYCFKFKNVYSLDIHVYINIAIYSDPFFVSTIDISNMFYGQDLWLRKPEYPKKTINLQVWIILATQRSLMQLVVGYLITTQQQRVRCGAQGTNTLYSKHFYKKTIIFSVQVF